MRRKIHKYILLLSCLPLMALTVSAQNQEQAKKLFNAGKYAEAKPAFQKLIKRNPKNGSLNYWYGVCLYETGESDKCLPYLKHAAEREVREANRYLAKYYFDNYQFNESEACWDTYFELMEKAKKPTESYEAEADRSALGRQMMHGVKDVAFIDSFTVDKKEFLKAYRLSQECGTLSTFNDFFKAKDQPQGIVHQTERKNKIFYSKADEKGRTRLYAADLLNNQWEEGKALEGIPTASNANYPYIMSDGATFYFAADGEESLGGYDIFVTRFNSEDNKFLVPENMGMPFNSPANDYMLVIDEFNDLGWFATDRRQTDDKVCIYVFNYTEEMSILQEESIPTDQLIGRAQLTNIKATWKKQEEVNQAKERLASAATERTQEVQQKDFELFINDAATYYTLKDFKSKEARTLATRWLQEVKSYASLSKQLEQKREAYTQANKEKKASMKASLLDLEKHVENLELSVNQLEQDTRNAENRHLGKK